MNPFDSARDRNKPDHKSPEQEKVPDGDFEFEVESGMGENPSPGIEQIGKEESKEADDMIKADIGEEVMPNFQKIQVNKASANLSKKPAFTAGNVV